MKLNKLLNNCLLVLVIVVILLVIKNHLDKDKVLDLDTYCTELIKFAEKMKKTNPEVKHEDFMYLSDPVEKMDKCKQSVRRVFKLQQDSPIVHPMMIDILKCMKTTNNFDEYRNCYHN